MNRDCLNSILNKFEVSAKVYDFSIVNQGYINDTFLVTDNNKTIYILQRINKEVFKNEREIIANVAKALEYLRDEDYEPIDLVSSKKGDSFYKDDDESIWRLMTYIDNSVAFNTTTQPKIAFEAGRIIGKFHKLLQGVPTDAFVDTIPKFHNISFRENQYDEALNKAPDKRKNKARVAIEFVKSVLPKIKEWNTYGLSERICHNDTKLNNILFSKINDKALCLIDLDTLMKGYFHYDFGDAIRTIVNTAPEDEQDFDKITFNKELFEAFVEGMKSNGAFLDSSEISFLPFGVILMPFYMV